MVQTVMTWYTADDSSLDAQEIAQRNQFIQERLAEMIALGKTTGDVQRSYSEDGTTMTAIRTWVDEDSANEWISFNVGPVMVEYRIIP